MNCRRRNRTLFVALAAAGICLAAAPTARADGYAFGTGEITNIQYGLVNPADGTINWFWDDGFGNPDWHGEAWVQVADSLGGADADYNTTPDGNGVVSAFASTTLAWGSADVDLLSEELYGANEAIIPLDGWAYTAASGMMFDYFSIIPADPDNPDPIEMAFSFDYEIHLVGQAEPGAPYYSDASVGMSLEYEDEPGDWQLVPDGQLFRSEVITGSGTDSDDETFSGTLSTTVGLDPCVTHAVVFWLDVEIPEPATFGLLLAGGLIALRRRARTAR